MITRENTDSLHGPRYSFTEQGLVPVLSIAYLAWAWLTSGIRGDQVFLAGLVNACYFFNPYTRRFILGFSIFVVYWIVYDSMKLLPNFAFRPVDIEGLYTTERALFGIHAGNLLLTPNEYFLQHSSLVLDILCSLFYLCWVPVPLIFAFYLYRKDKQLFLRFSLGFFVTNLVGFIIYYSHPAAPPWYVQEYGYVFHPEVKPNIAGLLRFDQYFNIHLFGGLYSKGSNVFGAMPSLHSAYPVLMFYYSLRQKNRVLPFVFAFVMSGIWFSAVYLTHHYILDVLAGILCAIVGILILEKGLMKQPWFYLWLNRFEKVITR